MKNAKKLTIYLSICFLLLKCNKQFVVNEEAPYPFQKSDAGPTYEFRVHKNDKELLNKYVDYLRACINFHNMQIDDYFESFEKRKKDAQQ